MKKKDHLIPDRFIINHKFQIAEISRRYHEWIPREKEKSTAARINSVSVRSIGLYQLLGYLSDSFSVSALSARTLSASIPIFSVCSFL